MLRFDECLGLVVECFEKNVHSININIDNFINDEKCIDSCIDIVSDCLCEFGLQDNYEPNEYGLKLEAVISFLLDAKWKLQKD